MIEPHVHAEYYYADVVLFCDEHHTKILKSSIPIGNEYIYTHHATEFINTVVEHLTDKYFL